MAHLRRPRETLDQAMNHQDENYRPNSIQLRSKGNFEEPVSTKLTNGKPMATRLSRQQRAVMMDIGNNPIQGPAARNKSYIEAISNKENNHVKQNTAISCKNDNIHQSIIEEPKAKRKFCGENAAKPLTEKMAPKDNCNEVDSNMVDLGDMQIEKEPNPTVFSDVSMASPVDSNTKTDQSNNGNSVPSLMELDDVDIEDTEDPQMVSTYVNDIFVHLRWLEDKYEIDESYLRGKKGVIIPKMRAVLTDWMVDVHQQFTLLQETLYLSVAILDRYMQRAAENVPRKKLQLVGVTAMFIAAKYEEMYAPEIGDFVYITDNAYSESQIREQEIEMIKQLNFSLERPLPLHFLRRYSKVGQVDTTIHNLAKYIMELTIVEYKFCHIPPSKIAAASLAVSMMAYECDTKKSLRQLWSPTLEHYSFYTLDSIANLVQDLAGHLLKISRANDSTRIMAVRKKYSDKKFLKISMNPELTGLKVRKLADGEF